jgi:hypothetical protein
LNLILMPDKHFVGYTQDVRNDPVCQLLSPENQPWTITKVLELQYTRALIGL